MTQNTSERLYEDTKSFQYIDILIYLPLMQSTRGGERREPKQIKHAYSIHPAKLTG